MLKEYMSEASLRGSDLAGEAAAGDIVGAFDAGVDFLRDPEQFRDPVTNIVVTAAYRLIGNQYVLPAIIPEADIPTLSVAVMGSISEPDAFILFPHRFHSKVAKDPILQLGATAFVAEKTRLFMQGHLRSEIDETADKRAWAVESGMVSHISELLEIEEIAYELTPIHAKLREDFPDGIRSLSEAHSSGNIVASQADHIQPEQPACPETIQAIGDLDFVALASSDIAQISAQIMAQQQHGEITSLKDVEYYLRQATSSLFLHAYPSNHYGSTFEAMDPITQEPSEFALGLTRCGPDGRTSPSLVLDELGESYEENVEKLDRTGVFTAI